MWLPYFVLQPLSHVPFDHVDVKNYDLDYDNVLNNDNILRIMDSKKLTMMMMTLKILQSSCLLSHITVLIITSNTKA